MKGRRTRHILTIGITGGIGSGKSEVCAIFASLGAKTIDADALAKELLNSDPVLRARIRKEFGPAIYSDDGSLDRRQLAKLVFRDVSLLGKLNALVHPRVIGRIKEIIAGTKAAAEAPMVVVEAALIYEARLDSMFDYIVVVDAQQEERLARVAARDRASVAEVRDRMRAQLSPATKAEQADFVIRNEGNLDQLGRTCRFLFGLLSKLVPAPAGDVV